MLVQEEDDETGERDLCGQVQRGAAGEQPHSGVARRARHVAELRGAERCVAHQRSCDKRSADAAAAEDEKRKARPAGGREPGQARRRGRAADRNGGLPDAEGEPDLLGAEPPHHRASARRVDAGAERAGDD